MSIGLISFSTPKYHEVYASHLEPTEVHWGSDKMHIKYGDCHSWAKNTQFKPRAIREALDRWDSCLYLDSDAKITDERVNTISEAANGYPIACVFLDHSEWYGNDSKTIEPLAGTLYFTRAAIPFIEKWDSMLQGTDKTDGEAFANILASWPIPAQQLGIEWAYIASLPRGGKGGIPCNSPIVTHHQASRRFKCLSI